jgi:copper(I)-binding protein
VTRRRALAVAALGAWAVALGGCYYYPTVQDVGGTRILPAKGRAVRQGGGAAFYCELQSVGKFGDTIVGVTSSVARDARLVDGQGQPVQSFAIAGETTVALAAGGTHVVLSDLARPLVAGETIIVTLVLEKAGGLGVVAVVE